MVKRTLVVLAIVAFPIQLATQAPAQTAAPCVQQGNTQYVCGQTAPEDLVQVPGSDWVVASVYGGTGGIRIINTKDKSSTIGYPSATAKEELDRKTYDSCPGPPDAAQKVEQWMAGAMQRIS